MRPTTLFSLAALLVACADPGSAGQGEVSDAPEPSPTSAPLTEEPTEPALAHACFAEPLSVEVGRGDSDHVPVAPGDPVTMVNGPQQGWHIDVSGFVEGASDVVEIEAVVRVVDADWIIAGLEQQPVRTALVGWSEDECAGTFYGLRLYLDDNGPHSYDTICALAGAAVDIEVSLTDLSDPDGERTHETTGLGTLALDPNDIEPCGG